MQFSDKQKRQLKHYELESLVYRVSDHMPKKFYKRTRYGERKFLSTEDGRKEIIALVNGNKPFMVGRYGMDHFGRFLVYFSLVLMIISLFFPKSVVYWLALAVLGYSYFRMFSRNTNSRYRENLKYLECKNRVIGFWRSRGFGRSRAKQDPTKKDP